MIQTDVQAAENNLAQLIEKAIEGEEVIIELTEKRQVKLVPVIAQIDDWFGMDEGKGWIADDFDETPEEFATIFQGDGK